MPDLQYACARETGAYNGMLHYHLILTGWRYTPFETLSQLWASRSKAWVINIQRVRYESVAAYIAKYVSKNPAIKAKHVTYSAHWPKLVPLSKIGTRYGSITLPNTPTPIAQTTTGALLEKVAPNCYCWGAYERTSLDTLLWLMSLQGRSPPQYQAA